MKKVPRGELLHPPALRREPGCESRPRRFYPGEKKKRKKMVTKKTAVKKATKPRRWVIIRSYGAGAFLGVLRKRTAEPSGISVVLDDCIRLHAWTGCSLSQVACDGLAGTGENRFSMVTQGHEITGVIEIIPASKKAVKAIQAVPTWKI